MQFIKIFLFTIIAFLAVKTASAQTEVSWDGSGNKIIKGFMTKQELVTDTAFAWYAENLKGYIPNQDALQSFRANKDSINIIAFGGTWCGDTKYVLPKFLGLMDAAGVSQNRITLIGVDRDKKTIHYLAEAFNVTLVPTIIIMKNGKEIGRVVEYGKSGMFDKDLGEILTGK